MEDSSVLDRLKPLERLLKLMGGPVLALLLIAGSVLIYLGVRELKLASTVDATPQTISCDDLEASGYGDNAHVVLTEFYCPEEYVYDQVEGRPGYVTIWIPAVPLESDYVRRVMAAYDEERDPSEIPLPDVRLIIQSSRVSTDAEVSAMADQDTLQGLVTSGVESLDGETVGLLRRAYPDLDPAKVLVLEHGRSPSRRHGFVLIASGLVLVLIPIGLVVRSSQKGA